MGGVGRLFKIKVRAAAKLVQKRTYLIGTFRYTPLALCRNEGRVVGAPSFLLVQSRWQTTCPLSSQTICQEVILLYALIQCSMPNIHLMQTHYSLRQKDGNVSSTARPNTALTTANAITYSYADVVYLINRHAKEKFNGDLFEGRIRDSKRVFILGIVMGSWFVQHADAKCRRSNFLLALLPLVLLLLLLEYFVVLTVLLLFQ